jgi:hypothetical protein
MKRDFDSLLSVSKAAMKLPIMTVPLALPFDIRDDESTSTTFDVLDDSIRPAKYGIFCTVQPLGKWGRWGV